MSELTDEEDIPSTAWGKLSNMFPCAANTNRPTILIILILPTLNALKVLRPPCIFTEFIRQTWLGWAETLPLRNAQISATYGRKPNPGPNAPFSQLKMANVTHWNNKGFRTFGQIACAQMVSKLCLKSSLVVMPYSSKHLFNCVIQLLCV